MEFSQFLARMADLVSTKAGANSLKESERSMYRYHYGRRPLDEGTPLAPQTWIPFIGRTYAQRLNQPQTLDYRFTDMPIAIEYQNNRSNH